MRLPRIASILTRSMPILIVLCLVSEGLAQTAGTDQNMTFAPNVGAGADLFSAQGTSSVPIDVPSGRHGIQPALSLQYSSSNVNGWVGLGWKLDVGSVERNTRFGLTYTGDDYVFRLSGANTDLVNVGSGEYRAKIEGGFSRVRKLTGGDGQSSWEATDKKGIRYLFGQTAASRMADPADPTKIFKWNLDKVIDPHGNYLTVTYVGDQGEQYLQRIDYTGNNSLAPTNSVQFFLEPRPDSQDSYASNYRIQTASRLKTIDVQFNGSRIRAYKLDYTISSSTGRSQLTSVQQYGRDAVVDGSGSVTGGAPLPPSTFSFTVGGNNFNTPTQWLGDNGPSGPTANQHHQYVADFNGDGKVDWMYNYLGWFVALSNGNGFDPPTLWMTDSGPGGPTFSAYGHFQFVGDFNGDGKTDFMYNNINNGQWYVMLSNGQGFDTPTQWLSGTGPSGPTANQYSQYVGDFNGDGKMDFVYNYLGWYVALSNGNGFGPPTLWMTDAVSSGPTWSAYGVYQRIGDFNGDGKTDFMYNNINNNFWYVMLSNGTSFNAPTQWLTNSWNSAGTYHQYHQYWVDLNGDGKTDYMYNHQTTGEWYVVLSTGSSFTQPAVWLGSTGPSGVTLGSNYYYQFIGDFNGDGKNDYLYHNNGWYVALSTGKGFTYPTLWLSSNGPSGPTYNQYHMRVADFNGDGKADFLYNYLGWYVARQDGMGDLLSSVNNGIGGITTIRFVPSTLYSNTQLPFPVQTVNFIKTEDGNGNVSVTNYDYNGGFYHIGERDFRGFHFVKASGPVGPSGEQSITETWFHQGNDVLAFSNNPNVPDGFMKGRPYRTRISDSAGTVYAETSTNYVPDTDNLPPWFTPVQQVQGFLCAIESCNPRTQTGYQYDAYGNVTREDQHGDLGDTSDDRTVVRSFGLNTSAWIVGLPASETIYQGIGTSGQAAQTSFYYDGTTSCGVASSNQVPALGNLTRVVRWLSGGTSPDTRMAYDAYGNLICTSDANGTSTLSYDTSATFPKITINPLGHQKITQYYGVDGMPADAGLYGQVKSITDPNNATISTTYDVFGRKVQVSFADGSWAITSYNSFGTVGSQHIQTTTAAALSSFIYFDGLGRVMTERKTGPDSKTIAVQTQYNVRGAVAQTSLPYFFGTESPRWKSMLYDPLGRVLQVTNPDASRGLHCTSHWVTATIDANNHKRRETRDAYGRLIRVDEYTGFSACTTDAGVPYATTTYQYDVLGNLRFVTDAKGNRSEMRYDTLSRKTFMHDPDMGDWTYLYDSVGNLIRQTDAKAQNLYFQYDALNRRRQTDALTQKALGSGDVRYTYDGQTSNGKGRLTSVVDLSGSVSFYYDVMGRTTRSDKVLDGSTYVTQTAYDTLGRIVTVTYPDNAVVGYTYNGPLLQRVYEGPTTYAQYAGYNALGQPGTLTFGNGVVTTYTYAGTGNSTCPQQNSRPCTLKTTFGSSSTENVGGDRYALAISSEGQVEGSLSVTDTPNSSLPLTASPVDLWHDRPTLTSMEAVGRLRLVGLSADLFGLSAASPDLWLSAPEPPINGLASNVPEQAVLVAQASPMVNMSAVFADVGFSYLVNQNFGTPGDTNATPTISVLRIFENGIELGPPHSLHADITSLGGGRFSHWGSNLFFTASNNTDPRTNGRTYTYQIGSASVVPPAVPSGLTATATSSSTITLTWTDQSTNESGFKIERRLGAGAFSPVVTVGANITTYADSALTANTAYSYRVRATNTADDSAYSATASATTTATTANLINMSAVVADVGFSYLVNQNFGTPGDTNATPTISVLRIFENGIELGPPHSLHADITSLGGGRFSHWGSNLFFTASNNTDPRTNGRTYTYQIGSASVVPPAVPSGLTATATSSSTITLTWTDQSTNESGFKIERRLGAGAFSPVVTVGANITTYADSALTANTAYSYRVRATNTAGDSAYSATASATTTATTANLINMSAVVADVGFSYLVNQNFGTPGDTNATPTISVLRIFENGIELGPSHALHADITSLGGGRFSHWGGNLFFSASNNTDPRTNGRTYTYQIGVQTGAYQDLLYSYDTGGNISAITDAVNGNQTFGYDDLNRLTTASGPYGSQTYSYNEIGNMLSNPLVGNYSYPTSGASSVRPHAVSTAGSNTYQYDANGNMQTGAGRTISYDPENRPISVTLSGVTTTFVYDGDGGRVKKIAGTTTVRYIGKLYECDTTGGATACVRYIFAGDRRIAVRQVNNANVDYYHTDHLGSSSVITTGAGVKEENITYYPYGATRTNTGIADVPYKYTGKELDTSTGLYFYEARYYDPVLGRFISADSIVPGASDPQAFNRYSYVRNNPLIYTDPTGHAFLGSIGKFFNSPLGQAIGWAFMPVNQAFLNDTTRPYAVMAAVAVATYYTGGAVSGFVQASMFEGVAAGLVTQEAIGAAIVAAAPGINAAGAIVGGAAGGLAGGSINAIATGSSRDLGRSVLLGAVGGVPGAFGPLGFNSAEILMGKALIGGATSVLNGGHFQAGFAFAGAANLMDQVYSSYVGFEIDAGPGGGVVQKNPGQYAVQGKNNFAKANCSGFWCEGGALSLFMNKVPLMNALAGLHDTVTGRLQDVWHIPFGASNYTTMAPSAALTYGAAIDHYGLSNDVITGLKVGGRRK